MTTEQIKEIAWQVLCARPAGEIVTKAAWVGAICAADGGIQESDARDAVNNMLPSTRDFYIPVVRTLQEMGGVGRKGEVVRRIIEKGEFDERLLAVTTESNNPVVENNIGWARSHLVGAGFMVDARSGNWGQWELTQQGQQVDTESLDPSEFAGKVNRLWQLNRGVSLPQESPDEAHGDTKSPEIPETPESPESPETPPDEELLADALLKQVVALESGGFELFCGRLLRAVGFEDVHITQSSRDGGYDGTGLLVMNSVVPISFVFECKCWTNAPVPVDIIRALRGKIGEGVAEKGAVITTTRFTKDARTAAGKAPLIGLVDGDAIVELMQKHFLGVKHVQITDADETKEELVIDEPFFARFKGKKSDKV